MKKEAIVALVVNLSALLVVVSYVGMLWYEYERKGLPLWGIVMFVVGMLGLLASAIGIYLTHFVFRLM